MLNLIATLYFAFDYNCYYMGLDGRKPVFGVCEQKGADKPEHMRSLISAFVVRLTESIMPSILQAKFQCSSLSL